MAAGDWLIRYQGLIPAAWSILGLDMDSSLRFRAYGLYEGSIGVPLSSSQIGFKKGFIFLPRIS